MGTLARANANGLNVDIFPGANLKLTLEGDFEVNDSWVLMRYHTLVGAFEQGTSYTNQGVPLSWTTDRQDSERLPPGIHCCKAHHSYLCGIALRHHPGRFHHSTWEVGFDQLTIEPGIGNVNGSTTNGKGQVEVSPTQTTTYELKLEKGELRSAPRSSLLWIRHPSSVNSMCLRPSSNPMVRSGMGRGWG